MSLQSDCKKGKKGILYDVVILMAGIVGVIITLIIASVVLIEFKAEMVNSGLQTEYDAQVNESLDKFQDSFAYIDYLFFPVAVVGLTVALIITSLFIPSHPIFAIINVIGVVFLVFLAVVLQSVYEQIVNMPELQAGLGAIVYSEFVMISLPWIGAVAVLLATIIGYSKKGELY